MGRRVVRTIASLSALMVLFSTASAHTEDDVKSELNQTQEQLEGAKQGLEQAEEKAQTAEEDLAVVTAKLGDLQAQLRQREAELAAARAELEAVRARTDEAKRQLDVVTRRLLRAQEELDERERRFDDRVSATYKYGGVSYASALVGADDVASFLNTMYYVRSVMDTDRRIIDSVTEVATSIAEDRAEADRLREQLERDLAATAAAEAAVAAAAAEQRALTGQVATQKQKQAALLADYQEQASDYAELVNDLEKESQQLAAELKKLQARTSSGPRPSASGMVWPTNGRVTSSYGYRTHPISGQRKLHAGVDISGSTGQTILAATAGTVVHAGWYGGYGLAVVIDHGGGMATLYAHQSTLAVGEGQSVSTGQTIGYVGSTGYSTGPHLHFEVRINGEPRDPMQWY